MATRSGRTATKAEIGAAANRLFVAQGFGGTSLREIAGEVGVDAALIIRYFGSKELLFLDAMRLDDAHSALLDGPLDTLGERFVGYLLGSGEQTRSVFLALVRASDSEGVSSRLREAHETLFVAPLLGRLPGPDAPVRARLAASVLGGLLYSLWIVGDEVLLAEDRHELARRYGAVLQSVLTP